MSVLVLRIELGTNARIMTQVHSTAHTHALAAILGKVVITALNAHKMPIGTSTASVYATKDTVGISQTAMVPVTTTVAVPTAATFAQAQALTTAQRV